MTELGGLPAREPGATEGSYRFFARVGHAVGEVATSFKLLEWDSVD